MKNPPTSRLIGGVRHSPMSEYSTDHTLPEPFVHEESGAVRFWVRTPAGDMVGAIVRKDVMHFRFNAPASGIDAMKTYEHHRGEIDAAVLRRVAAGSIEPVILREADFAAH
jgi:hypothetical protein